MPRQPTSHSYTATTTTTTRNKERRLVPFAGQYWEVFWGEVDGLGLCYSSQVDLIDRSSQFLSNCASLSSSSPHSSSVFSSFFSSSAMHQLVQVLSKRLYMYRTHFCPPPKDTEAWRERMWWVECLINLISSRLHLFHTIFMHTFSITHSVPTYK